MNDKTNSIEERERTLKHIIAGYSKACIGFSGGVDSTLLLYLASQLIPVVAVTADGPMVTRSDIKSARDFTDKLDNAEHIVYPIDVLEVEDFKNNTPERCYACKKRIFSAISQTAQEKECDVIFDGANIDDLGDYRPGMRATGELGVVSPFIKAGITKDDIYYLSKKYNLPTKNKPAAACLASRIPTGEPVSREKLKKVEEGEAFLKELGFKQVRLRLKSGTEATVECFEEDFPLFQKYRKEIISELEGKNITLSTKPRVYKQGSMNASSDRQEKL